MLICVVCGGGALPNEDCGCFCLYPRPHWQRPWGEVESKVAEAHETVASEDSTVVMRVVRDRSGVQYLCHPPPQIFE